MKIGPKLEFFDADVGKKPFFLCSCAECGLFVKRVGGWNTAPNDKHPTHKSWAVWSKNAQPTALTTQLMYCEECLKKAGYVW